MGKNCPNKAGKNPLHSQAQRRADQASHQTQQHRLEKIDAQDVRGARADGFHDGEHLNPLLQMRAHGHRHADGAQHHGHQADQAEQPGRSLQAVGKRRITFPEVGDLRIGQHLLEARAHGGDTSAVTAIA